jgi:quercetin dioxygenase-like cupin family protein
MEHFPDFMKNLKNKIDPAQQNTPDIEGYYYEGADGCSQMAFWECHSDRISKKHAHDFDEYTICVSGEYVACFEDKEVVLKPGDELYVPKGTMQWGRCKAGTGPIPFRGTIHQQDENHVSSHVL